MSSVYWNITLPAILNNATAQINRYLTIPIFVFGVLGNILNVLVLVKHPFRTNSCASLFLFSSIGNCISLIATLINRIIGVWSVDLSSTIGWLCQFRTFMSWVPRTFALYIIVLATVDRWLLTSTDNHRRQMSTLKNAYRGIIITFIISILIYIHIFFCQNANIPNAPSKCYGINDGCRLFTDFFYAFVSNIIPISLMLLFGTMTISNVRHSQQRVQPQMSTAGSSVITQSGRSKKVDRHLLITLLMQVILLSFLLMPSAIQRIYSTLTIYDNRSSLRVAIENLTYNTIVLFICIACGSTFYIFTLCGGKAYRNAVRNLMKHLFTKICC